MVIYQTLNEYSASGIYDQSGLGMNMFLKIREYLVNEETFFFLKTYKNTKDIKLPVRHRNEGNL